MVVDVSTHIIIDQPREKVSAYAAEPSNAPKWYVNIKSARWRTTPPLVKGSLLDFEPHFIGRKLSYTYMVTEYVPERLLSMSTAEGPFKMETTYSWDSEPDGRTRMTLRNCGQPSGFSKILSPFMRFAMRRANRKDLARLKAILENSPDAHPDHLRYPR